MTTLRRQASNNSLWIWLIVLAVMILAVLLGYEGSARWLFLLIAGIGAFLLLQKPVLGLLALVTAALVLPLEFGTGTEVSLNPAALLVPILLLLRLLDIMRRREVRIDRSRPFLPLLLFLLASLLSLLIGNATWDPDVPRSANFLWVQLAQWAIFAFSAGAFWLMANLIKGELWLRRLTWTFLFIVSIVTILRAVPFAGDIIGRLGTIAFIRAPFWALLTALAGGQLFYNRTLSPLQRGFFVGVLVYAVYYGFVQERESSSTWVGVGAALGILVWLRFPRLRWFVVFMVITTSAAGILFPSLWNFAGGDDAWFTTGGSRLALIERVIEVTMRNPITGLGPAGYRPYANATPLIYAHIFWADPRVSSHNDYVDLFAHGGLLGLVLFGWFCGELYRVAMRLRRRFSTGFTAGYVNAMLAVAGASLVLMLFADWILPFVYNIGFPGFQASVLVWLFLGGLVALDNLDDGPSKQ